MAEQPTGMPESPVYRELPHRQRSLQSPLGVLEETIYREVPGLGTHFKATRRMPEEAFGFWVPLTIMCYRSQALEKLNTAEADERNTLGPKRETFFLHGPSCTIC